MEFKLRLLLVYIASIALQHTLGDKCSFAWMIPSIVLVLHLLFIEAQQVIQKISSRQENRPSSSTPEQLGKLHLPAIEQSPQREALTNEQPGDSREMEPQVFTSDYDHTALVDYDTVAFASIEQSHPQFTFDSDHAALVDYHTMAFASIEQSHLEFTFHYDHTAPVNQMKAVASTELIHQEFNFDYDHAAFVGYEMMACDYDHAALVDYQMVNYAPIEQSYPEFTFGYDHAALGDYYPMEFACIEQSHPEFIYYCDYAAPMYYHPMEFAYPQQNHPEFTLY